MAQPEFSQIVASAARESVVYQDLSTTGSTVAASGTEIIDVYAPSGAICEMMSIYLQALTTGGSSGTHFFKVSTTQAFGDFLYGESTFDSAIRFQYGEWQTANSLKYPIVSSPSSLIQQIVFDSVTGLRIRYRNLSNLTQTNTRNYVIQYKKRIVG